MPSLVDIAPLTEEVDIRGTKLTVRGIGVDAIARVLAKSEDLRRMMVGKSVDPMMLLTAAPDVAFALMAEALGKGGDAEEEAAARGLVFEDQLKLVEAIFRMSFPGGINPLIERLTGMLGPGGAGPGGLFGRVQDTSSPQPLTS
jgi:hypothetical protein